MRTNLHAALRLLVIATVAGTTSAAAPPSSGGPSSIARATLPADRAAVIDHWTPERRRAAQPRDLVLDERGLPYLALRGGALVPYGHRTPARLRTSAPAGTTAASAGPTTTGSVVTATDTTKPAVSSTDPAAGATIGASYTFGATVTDTSGVKSVSFVIRYPDGRTSTYTAAKGASGRWSLVVSGLYDGSWAWWIVAKDGAPKGGNTTTTAATAFTVSTTGSGGSGGGSTSGDTGGSSTGGTTSGPTVANAAWSGGGAAQTAAGRIYFEMPTDASQTNWAGYVCSGTAVTDARGDASIIVTAAHCVYDDVEKAFARNVLFIPNQAGTTAAGTDLSCWNDPIGCWTPSYGVVDADWASRTFPDNIPWDYAYYVVPTAGAHSAGFTAASDSLEAAAGTLPLSFTAPAAGAYTTAFGYSWRDDPKLMYCAGGLSTYGSANWYLSSCGLSGGASGGPWSTGGAAGPIVSVNSWGWSDGSPGMAGPLLAGSSANCLFNAAQNPTLLPSSRGLLPAGC